MSDINPNAKYTRKAPTTISGRGSLCVPPICGATRAVRCMTIVSDTATTTHRTGPATISSNGMRSGSHGRYGRQQRPRSARGATRRARTVRISGVRAGHSQRTMAPASETAAIHPSSRKRREHGNALRPLVGPVDDAGIDARHSQRQRCCGCRARKPCNRSDSCRQRRACYQTSETPQEAYPGPERIVDLVADRSVVVAETRHYDEAFGQRDREPRAERQRAKRAAVPFLERLASAGFRRVSHPAATETARATNARARNAWSPRYKAAVGRGWRTAGGGMRRRPKRHRPPGVPE